MSSSGHQHRRPWPCTSRLVLGIGGSLVAYRPILEREGTVVCMSENAVVLGPMAEVGVSECEP